MGKRCLVFCISKNHIGSLVGYLSFLTNKVVPLILNSDIPADILWNVTKKYKPKFIWLPVNQKHNVYKCKAVLTLFDYVLLKMDWEPEYSLNNDLALLLSTSGTLGSSKLVRLSYENISSNAFSISEYLSINENERPITVLPMHYSFGLSIINSHIVSGATILLTDYSLMDKRFWTFLKAKRATSLSGVPYTFEILKKLKFFNLDLPYLKTITQAGGKLSEEINREFSLFCQNNQKQFFVMYGQTEASPRISYLPAEYALSKLGSVGVAIPGGQLSLLDKNKNFIIENETVGELVYKGPNVFMGYAVNSADLMKEDENNKILVTGDMAKRDSDGFYYIVGRKKRFVKLYGNRINLDEVEQLLKTIISDVACVGVDDRMVIYTINNKFTMKIKTFISKTIKINTKAYVVKTINKIPKNASGKIAYSKLSI